MRAQVHRWQRQRRGRPFPSESLDRAHSRARAALAQIHSPAREELRARNIRLVPADLRIGSVVVRARLELDQGRLLYDPAAARRLGEAMAWGGLDRPADPLDLVLAHELFHVLEPECPEPEAEAAAHLFATELLKLDYFAGSVDELEKNFNRVTR